MTEQEAMQILADMGLHEGGMDNWVPDNAWYRFANVVEAAARADERERIEKAWDKLYGWWEADDETETRGTT
jgi:hypothetical protein